MGRVVITGAGCEICYASNVWQVAFSVEICMVCAAKGLTAPSALPGFAGKPVAQMVSAFEERRNYVVQRLKQIPDVKLAEPQVRKFHTTSLFGTMNLAMA